MRIDITRDTEEVFDYKKNSYMITEIENYFKKTLNEKGIQIEMVKTPTFMNKQGLLKNVKTSKVYNINSFAKELHIDDIEEIYLLDIKPLFDNGEMVFYIRFVKKETKVIDIDELRKLSIELNYLFNSYHLIEDSKQGLLKRVSNLSEAKSEIFSKVLDLITKDKNEK